MIVDDFEAIAKALKRIQQPEAKPFPRKTPTPEDDEAADMHFYESVCNPDFDD